MGNSMSKTTVFGFTVEEESQYGWNDDSDDDDYGFIGWMFPDSDDDWD